jgi:peptidoglycan lytic transglycosylase G
VSERRSRGRGGRRGGRRSLRRTLAALGFALLLVSTAAAAFWFWSRRSGERHPVFVLTLRGDESVSALRDELERVGALDHPLLFEAYLELTRSRPRLKPGPHLLRPGLSPAEIVARLTRSPARRRVKLTIPEGFNRFQIAERVEKLELTSAALFIAETENEARLHELGVAAPTAEGYLFPATYDLLVDSEPGLVAATLVRETKRRLERLLPREGARTRDVWQREGWGEREALTLASIVEKEAADRGEHGNIASVFYNRLTDATFRPRRMLQSDATAAYGCITARAQIDSCRDYTGLVTPAMLRDATNPYNTYKHPGLPPGPIGNPSESAILSVLDPPETPYFFFVAGTAKRHVFSRTFAEHARAIVTGVPGADVPGSAAEAAAGN